MTKTDFMTRKVRVYRSLPTEERLRRWHEKVLKSTLREDRKMNILLPARLAELLGLPDQCVTLWPNGTLWHHAKEQPLATIG